MCPSVRSLAVVRLPVVVPSETLQYPPRLFLRDGQRVLCVPTSDIVWVEAAGNYVQIHTLRKTLLVRHTVKAMQEKLDPDSFVRVRPSAIVAKASVAELNARHGGDYTVVLLGGTQIRSSRGYRECVENALGHVAGTAHAIVVGRRRRRAGRASDAVRPAATTAAVPGGPRSEPPACTLLTA